MTAAAYLHVLPWLWTRGHSQGSLPKWSIHESCRGGYLCGDLLRGGYSLYKVVLLWLWNGALNSDTWYRSWHLKSLEESMGTVKTHSCWAPPTKFPLRRVLWYFTFGHLFRRKASCRTTKCFIGSFKMRPLWVYSLDTEQSNNLLISVNLMLSLTRALAHDGRWFYKSLSLCCSISWSLLLLCPTEMRRSRDGQEEECSDRNL